MTTDAGKYEIDAAGRERGAPSGRRDGAPESWRTASNSQDAHPQAVEEVKPADWPPRFTMTPEGAIRLILARYDADGNVGKAELAILELMRQSYEAGKSGRMASP